MAASAIRCVVGVAASPREGSPSTSTSVETNAAAASAKLDPVQRVRRDGGDTDRDMG